MRLPVKRKALTMGVVLILLTNAIVIGGALYNRSGEPVAQLVLTDL